MIQPIGLLGATLAVQLSVLLLIAATNRVLPWAGGVPLQTRCDKAVLALTLITVMCISASDELYRASAPMFGDLAFASGLSRNTTFLVLFLADLILVFRLIYVTGGSKTSPFTAILFLLPTVAIFLREPPSRFLFYAILAGILYLFGLVVERRNSVVDIGNSRFGQVHTTYSLVKTDTPAHAIVNVGCLIIGITTGYVTRPIPI